MARRDFPRSDPIGRRVKVDEAGPRTIVGVVANAAFTELGVRRPRGVRALYRWRPVSPRRTGRVPDGVPRDLTPAIGTIAPELDRYR